MKFRKKQIWPCVFFLTLFLSTAFIETAWSKDFVVVIDAGHGGKDPGAVGKSSKEKDINLKVALKLGNLIKKNCKDVKVVYTREKDVFIALNRRAEIANNAKADLFISIHTNAVPKPRQPKGASTWTLGLARSEANLDVAKRENAVILYESDYKTRYAGFDPKSSESYIIFEFMQDKYMSQSVHLASLIQKHFKSTSKRVDQGVHQAEFLVLRATAMPSVLVELGFISTIEEERYLSTEQGTSSLASSIYQAFMQYKKEHDARFEETKEGVKNTPPTKTEQQQIEKPKEGGTIFKIQILTSSTALNANDKRFKGLKGVDNYKEGGIYKYTYGASPDYNEIVRTKNKIAADFKDAFIVAFKNNEKINISTAIQEFKKKNK
ncbi:N-acetylmuramoyl-L-alanine amidase [Bacteroides sp. 214]|uniref:N-acetylmuramoyl-L-alanine amidase family protein n=1 Tax=Bacteroides sp. 214 TaxID=2302935 RepID=UPI0013D15693|nr:N-acetylmuramoyl-L-alanine amidase [Bacteroides sp. 214]